MTEDEKIRLVRQYLAAYNRFDVPGMLEVLHPDVRFENVSDRATTLATEGRAAFAEQAERAARMFSEREQGVTAITSVGDSLELAIDYTGVLAEGIPGGPPAGQRIELTGTATFSFRDRLISLLRDES
ncbi:nuclear transport factor 2 family protein [Lewinella sp. IMCC34183]|uniref:nuclear transport factor 2 family protein n=1 Tax=Lewinella sp. IMCC34183 TaxID=2248762 RepID=UPI000E250688|nr:nuclear transport factor 2 family protein [Lewinella sp. IMCC34183]